MAMNTEINLHPIQAKILIRLLFHPHSRFSELNIDKLPTDHFNFHLKQLVVSQLLIKTANLYNLSSKGKEFANRLDTDKNIYESQAKIGVLIVCHRSITNQTQFLVSQRLKQPYFGFYGFISGKITKGETVFETAARELREEANLSGEITLTGVKHKMDYSPENILLEDKFFFVFRAEKLIGDLKENFEGGRNIWLTNSKISKLDHLFDGVQETIDMSCQKSIVFSETKYTVTGF